MCYTKELFLNDLCNHVGPHSTCLEPMLRRGVTYHAGQVLTQRIALELGVWGNSTSCYEETPQLESLGVKMTPRESHGNEFPAGQSQNYVSKHSFNWFMNRPLFARPFLLLFPLPTIRFLPEILPFWDLKTPLIPEQTQPSGAGCGEGFGRGRLQGKIRTFQKNGAQKLVSQSLGYNGNAVDLS